MSNQDYDQNAAQDAGRFAGTAEGDFSSAAQDVENAPENAERDVSNDFKSGEQDVENAPKGLASWIGDKIGGVEGDANKAEGDVRSAEGDVSNFDNSVDQSYNQGEQQGEKQGGW